MIYLIYSFGVLKAWVNELFDKLYTFHFEFTNKAKDSEPVIGVKCIVDQANITILP